MLKEDTIAREKRISSSQKSVYIERRIKRKCVMSWEGEWKTMVGRTRRARMNSKINVKKMKKG